MSKKLDNILGKLDEVRERRGELYAQYLKVSKRPNKAQKVRDKIRPLDLLLETYFRQAHKAYKKSWDELDELYSYVGFDKKRRIVYCDGFLHLVTSKKGKHKMGYFCNCD